jgi:putative ABC transport system permease protein
LIGLFILLIACFNYIILSTTNASKRNVEIGIQKAHGAARYQLIFQYLGESLLITTLAIFFAIILVENYLPVLNQLSGKQLTNQYNNLGVYIALILFTIILGILSGIYPAVFLSAFKPSSILKKEYYGSHTHKKNSFREYLVMVQFFISIGLIISAITIKKQLNYIENKDIGLDPHNIMVIPIHPKVVKDKCALFIERLILNPRIINASVTSYIPGELGYCQSSWWEGMPPNDKSQMLDWISVDSSFIKLLKIKVLQGSNFSNEAPNLKSYILNKTACKVIGWNNPIGKKMDIIGEGEVIGVVDDFNFKSLHNPVKPVALCIYPEIYEYLYVSVRPENISSTVQFIQNEWKKLFPSMDFSYSFLDNSIEKTYDSELKSGKVINYFAFIAIILSCLGIYSLVSYTTQKRTKEIGIRKANGASTIEIMFMLSKDLTIWIAIAFVIACPIAYYAMNRWLQNFAYKTTLSWWVFFIAGLTAVIIAIITVSWQAWLAASKNPVESLRYE